MKRQSSLIFTSVMLLGLFLISAWSIKSFSQKTPDKPLAKNLILLIGDGMGVSQVTAAMIMNGGTLNLERCPVIGLTKTQAKDNLITDSAAGATAIATGEKTSNGHISTADDGTPIRTILEQLADLDFRTGLIATCSILHATPAAFFGHNRSRSNYYELAEDLVHADVDVWIGGGKKYFNNRPDRINLLDSVVHNGYQLATSIQAIPQQFDRLAVLTHDGHQPAVSDGRNQYLSEGLSAILQNFAAREQRFFIMAEGSQIDWGGHDKMEDYQNEEMLDFDRAIGTALDFAKSDGQTLVVVCADHETGGYAIVDGSLKEMKVEGKFVSSHHTGTMVPVFAFGPGAELFGGIYENTDLYHKLKSALAIP